MTILTAILSFVVAIALLVTVHEFGHFLAAKLVGVKVLRFSVGLGRPVWKRQSRWLGTEFAIGAFPIGGYVKMLDERDEPVVESERSLSFNQQSASRKALVLVAGPAFNFLFAILAYWFVFVSGVPGSRPIVGDVAAGSSAATAGVQAEDQIVAINGEPTPTWERAHLALLGAVLDASSVQMTVVSPDGEQRTLTMQITDAHALTEPGAMLPGLGLSQWMPKISPEIGDITAGSAAERAGLQTGDVVTAVSGEAMENLQQLVERISAAPEKPLEFTILRNGEIRNLTVIPDRVQTEQGEVGRIGAAVRYPRAVLERLFSVEKHGIVAAIGPATAKTWEISMLTLRVLGRMVTGDVSLKNISGPINIANYAGQTASSGLVSFVTFLAIVSISLGVLNLLPIPILDGGHLIYVIAEAIKGSPVSTATEILGQKIGLLALALFMTLALYNDITRLAGLGG